ncbi:MAG: hypothetical protein CMP21_05110 [Rickettsiales bacterium]|nr:hypothetical protein [Rickettsiales bacterium]
MGTSVGMGIGVKQTGYTPVVNHIPAAKKARTEYYKFTEKSNNLVLEIIDGTLKDPVEIETRKRALLKSLNSGTPEFIKHENTLTEFINIAKLTQIETETGVSRAEGKKTINKFLEASHEYIVSINTAEVKGEEASKLEQNVTESFEAVEGWLKHNTPRSRSGLDQFYASVNKLNIVQSEKMAKTLLYKDYDFNKEIYEFFRQDPLAEKIQEKFKEVLLLNNLSKESQFRLEHRAYLEKQSVDEKIKQIIQKGNYGILETWATEDGVTDIKSYVKTTLQQSPQLIDLLDLDADFETKEGDVTGFERVQRHGIQNVGNTCFFNATIQMLLSMPEVQRLEELSDTTSDLAVRNSLVRLRDAVKSKDIEASTKQAMNFRETCIRAGINIEKYSAQLNAGGPQQDANEILRKILDSLNLDTSVKLESTIRYSDGTSDVKSSTQVETYHIVDLPIKDQKSLKQAIASFQAPEMMTGDDQYETSEGQKVDATKTTKLVEQQSTITFGLKRFEYERSTGADGRVQHDEKKINLEVTIDQSLTIDDKNYELTSVLIHQGDTTRTGHYYTYRKEGEQWFQYNDSCVTPVDLRDVLADAKRGAYTVSYSQQPAADAE